ncbi:hypothetical protein Thimo_0321 [Thioflavicoccus mobilis 8321]|uniref:CRISPR-associated protein (Cas_Cas02710) n=1 Tax=Thioflavicoccus mobilis 8321 TaxID=765912 RepID=L0GT56_9GAMM|nr:hypothetical protein [Thioflavicoccus mobilis]AGA89191.1 hypothetical protein Thimo_0321 [Thioflavicoccus mobilis 8321]
MTCSPVDLRTGLLVGIGLVTNSLFEWLADIGTWFGGGTVDDWLPVHRLLAVGLFAGELLAVAAYARGARKRYRPRVGVEPQPAQVHGLILFLSNLSAEQARAVQAGLTTLDGLAAFRAAHGGLNWRMPLEAIAHHAPRLQHVIVICSAGRTGSAGQWPLFRALVQRVFPGAAFELRSAAQLDSRFGAGIDFEDVDGVAQATDDAYVHLLERGLPHSEILIDVTGGQKTNAIAATAVALAEGRRIQYVACDRDTCTCHLNVYDVTYDG